MDDSDFDSDEDSDGGEITSEDDAEMLAHLGATRVRNENFLDEIVGNYDEKTFGDFYDQRLLDFRFNFCTQCHQSPEIIKWPNNNEKIEIENGFRDKGFPNIIGAIDGTHIRVDKPEEDAESYINRKGYYSVHMQAVCDRNRKIRDVFIGFPGSVHDSRVFQNSPLFNDLDQRCGHYFLLGDSGYPLTTKLLTPFKDRGQLNNAQINYNIRLARARYIIEHSFGTLKQKFRQLYHMKLRNMSYIVHLIRAACVLHNIALDEEIVLDEGVGDWQVANDVGVNHEDGEAGEDGNQDARRIRDEIVGTLNV